MRERNCELKPKMKKLERKQCVSVSVSSSIYLGVHMDVCVDAIVFVRLCMGVCASV